MTQVGCVVSFTRTWVRGRRPVRISVALERRYTARWTADTIALGLDGPIRRNWPIPYRR